MRYLWLMLTMLTALVFVDPARADIRTGKPTTPDPDFADRAVGSHVVFTATLDGWVDDIRRGVHYSAALPDTQMMTLTEYRFSVDRVLLGTLPSARVTLTTWQWFDWPMASANMKLLAGSKVLVWAYWKFDHGWRLYGSFTHVTDEGRIDPSMQQIERGNMWLRSKSGEFTLADVESELTTRGPRNPGHSFNGAQGVSLVCVTGVDTAGPKRIFSIMPLRHLIGRAGHVPRRLMFDRRELFNFNDIAPGDTLVIPLKPNNTADDVDYDNIYYGWKVDHGFVPALGTELDSLDHVVTFDGNLMRVRPLAVPR